MANVSITISDGLQSRIINQWGDVATWKLWVREQTRSHIVESRKRAAYEQRMVQFEADMQQIVGDDSDGNL